MGNKIKCLFDYQRFEQNEALDRLIKQTDDRYENRLSDDDLYFVNAAGEPGGYGGDITGQGGIEGFSGSNKENIEGYNKGTIDNIRNIGDIPGIFK